MSLIAFLTVNDYPVLIGDILLSRESEEPGIYLPTVWHSGELFPEGSGYVPTGVCQKLYIVNEKLSVAWAGKALFAEIFINALKEEFRDRRATPEDLTSFFNAQDDAVRNEISIICFGSDGHSLFRVGFNVSTYHSSVFGEVLCAGSGSERLGEIIQSDLDMYQSGSANPMVQAVSTVLKILTQLIGSEVSQGTTLLEYFGGGFEIISYVNRRVAKVRDITYLMWRGREINENEWKFTLSPFLIMRYDYYRYFLGISRIEVSGDEILKVNKGGLYVVSPINKTFDPAEFSHMLNPDFNSKFLCHCFFIDSEFKGPSTKIRVNFSAMGSQMPVVFNRVHGNLIISVREDFWTSILQGISRD